MRTNRPKYAVQRWAIRTTREAIVRPMVWLTNRLRASRGA